VIKSFSCKETKKVFNETFSRKLPTQIQARALVKLQRIDNATDINDLRIPPANRLEALSGNRKGQHSIRINDQYRICFKWIDGNAENVEITDYH